jgi:hypothetical protein
MCINGISYNTVKVSGSIILNPTMLSATIRTGFLLPVHDSDKRQYFSLGRMMSCKEMRLASENSRKRLE